MKEYQFFPLRVWIGTHTPQMDFVWVSSRRLLTQRGSNFCCNPTHYAFLNRILLPYQPKTQGAVITKACPTALDTYERELRRERYR